MRISCQETGLPWKIASNDSDKKGETLSDGLEHTGGGTDRVSWGAFPFDLRYNEFSPFVNTKSSN